MLENGILDVVYVWLQPVSCERPKISKKRMNWQLKPWPQNLLPQTMQVLPLKKAGSS